MDYLGRWGRSSLNEPNIGKRVGNRGNRRYEGLGVRLKVAEWGLV